MWTYWAGGTGGGKSLNVNTKVKRLANSNVEESEKIDEWWAVLLTLVSIV